MNRAPDVAFAGLGLALSSPLLATSLALAGSGLVYAAVLAAQVALLAAAAAGIGIARYDVLVSWATVQALANDLRRGVPATWDAAEGTR